MSVTFLTNEDKDVLDEQLENLSKGKVNSSGYSANKFLGTDADGNVVEKDPPVASDGGISVETDPTVPSWAKQSTKPTYTASEVGADPAGTASSAVGTHNTNGSAHSDIRDLISGLTTRLNALANSDDTTLDQLSEIVTYIKNNKSLIDGITTSKVNVSDIVNNLTTNTTNKPLSAAQGVALKSLIDAITVPTKVSELTNDKGYITGYTETDPTVPAWAKATNKPSYTKSEVGLGNVENVKQYSASNPPPYPVKSVAGKTGAVTLGTLSITGAATGSYDGSGNVEINIPTVAGPKGDDYVLTDADKEEIADIVGIVKVPDTPVMVDSVDDMTDHTKHYVLTTDGTIYAYMEREHTVITEAENRFDPSKASISARLSSSSGSVSGTSGLGGFVTDFLPVPEYDAHNPFNVEVNFEIASHADNKFAFFDASKALVGGFTTMGSAVTVGNGKTIIDLHKTDKGAQSTFSGVAYVRIQLFMRNNGSGGTASTALTADEIKDVTIKYQHESGTTTETTEDFFSTGIAYAPTFKTDLIGVLGEGNVVYLSDNLPAGTYTLKHCDDYTTVGTITVT